VWIKVCNINSEENGMRFCILTLNGKKPEPLLRACPTSNLQPSSGVFAQIPSRTS